MILNTITLHNFMSYDDASLDLSSCRLACLSGDNGAGKSAILDAVTWALWESARATSDDLIRAGQQEMWIDLTFELEGQHYRVRRSRQRVFARGGARAQPKGTLEFQVAEAKNGNGKKGKTNGNGSNGHHDSTGDAMRRPEWKSLSSATMRDTQQRICDVLRMDYDTFINSVYLKQGRADEFTTRAPAERKQVLSEILGLGYFDRLQELAKENARNRKARLEILEAGMIDGTQIEAELKQYRQQLKQTSETLTQLRAKRDVLSSKLLTVGNEIAEIQALQPHLVPTQNRLEELTQEQASLEEQKVLLEKRMAAMDELLSSVQDAESINARFKQLRQEAEALDNINLERQELDTRRLELRSAIATARGRLEVELEHLQQQHAALLASKEKLVSQLTSKDKLATEHEQFKRLLTQEAEMAQRQEAFTQLTARAEQLNTIIIETKFQLEAQLGQKQQSLSDLTALLQSRELLQSEQAELQSEQQELENAEVEFEHVEQQGLKIKQDIDAIDAEVAQLRKQQQENEHKRKELHDAKSLSMCPLCAAPIVDRAAVLDRYTHLHQDIDSHITTLQAKKAELEDKRSELRNRYTALKRTLERRKALDRRIGDHNARQAALGRAEENQQRLSAEIQDLTRKLELQGYAEIERESLIRIKAELHKLEFDPVLYSGLQAQIRSLRHVEIRYQQLKRDESDVARIESELPVLTAKIDEIKKSLDNNDFAPEERVQIKTVEKELERFPYDRAAHQAIKQELARLLPLVDKLKDIDRALVEKPLVVAEMHEIDEKLHNKRIQSQELQSSIAAWKTRIDCLPSLREKHECLTNELTESDAAIQECDRNAIVFDTNVSRLEEQLIDFEKKQQQITALITEINDYNVLAEAFGKKGIQAVIIENAVPEIEAEANALLSRLTENQMHVALITQQRTKQGNIVETLEIVIADQLGTRPYELYSGGEAFKINFAVRLALSRLLARRAGAKLQTLIIDEGFGSQDEHSRERLINAINAIRTDFARILIVTHIAEIKELFPIQIQVQKQNGRSSVNLVHAF